MPARPVHAVSPILAGNDGFTIVEVMVASFVLIVGILGVLTMMSGALRTTATSNTRIAATNLARELVETARELDYDKLNDVTAQMQARGMGSGSPWTIGRRGVTYTVTATTCAFDDPSDGYATTAPANACGTNVAGTDSNGDDFRRATFRLQWSDAGSARSISQTTLVVNPAGGLGPRILTITPLTQRITANVATARIVWTTTGAQSLRWTADDGAGSGSVTGSTSFTTDWNIGTSGSADEVLDGAYAISAQAFDDRGIPGETKRADVLLNRRAPYAPTGFAGGRNTRDGEIVDFEWSLNRERDILGYRVTWAGPDDLFTTGDDVQVCPAPAAGSMLAPATKSCADFGPQPGTQKYAVTAIDRDPGNALREGTPSAILTVNPAGTPPSQPPSLTVLTVGGKPELTWTAPPSPQYVAFYRIYRDGTSVTYADRYDRTTDGLVTTFTDSDPGATSHRYWVTAVDANYNESIPIGPVTWTP